MYKSFANLIVFPFSEATCNNYLSSGAKTKSQHDQHQIKHASQSRSTQSYFTHATKKGSIGNVDKVLCNAAQYYWVSDAPNAIVGNIWFHCAA